MGPFFLSGADDDDEDDEQNGLVLPSVPRGIDVENWLTEFCLVMYVMLGFLGA